MSKSEVLEQIRDLAGSWQPWDAAAWLRLREEAWTAGLHGALPALLQSAERASQRALKDGQYSLKSHKEAIDLTDLRKANPSYRWLGSKTRLPSAADMPKASGVQEPALSFSVMDEIEVGLQLAGNNLNADVVVTSEVCEFQDDGHRLDIQQGSRSSEATLLVRTNLEEFLARAAQGLSLVGKTHELLTALQDPYVLLCRGLVAFRGPSVQGFPFLERPASFNLVLRARPFRRAGLALKGDQQFFEDERQYHNLLERLNLVALAALERAREDAAAAAEFPRAPHVVLGICPGDYPLNSLAIALQEWHRVYAPHFASMVVACGCAGSKDAELMQRLERLATNSWTTVPPQIREAVVPSPHSASKTLSDLASTMGSEGDAIDKKVMKGLEAAAAAIAEAHKPSGEYYPRTPKTCTAGSGRKRPSGCLSLGEAVLTHQAMKAAPADAPGLDKAPSAWFGKASSARSTEASSRNSEVSSGSQRSSALAVRVQAELAKQQLLLLPEWHHASQETKVSTVPTPSRATCMESQEQGELGVAQSEVRRAAREMLKCRRGSQEAAELKSKLEALRHGNYEVGARPGSRRSSSVRGGPRPSLADHDISVPMTERRQSSVARRSEALRIQRAASEAPREIRPLTSR